MKDFFLHTIVFICGAAVLAIEILGTRILGPFYGVDIFLWSSLITVTLASLSCGYILGGRLADINPSIGRLCMMIAIAGMWMLLIPWMKHPLLSLTEPLGLRTAVLFASSVLFFIPLMLLGTIGPFAIKLKASNLAEVGRTSGNLFAISTVGSVLSAVLTGFYLIPNVGINRLTVGIGIVLLLTASFGLVAQKKSSVNFFIAFVILVCTSAFFLLNTNEPSNPSQGLLIIQQSPYAELRVLDTEAGRHLLIDGGIHGLVDTTTWESTLKYSAVMELPKYFFDEPGTMLLLGVGCGSLMKQYKNGFWKVEAVEIDPDVIHIAQNYFNLRESDGKLYSMDGRQFLTSYPNTYDVILLDAFGSSAIPFHLVTKEAFDLISAHLNSGGMFAMNVETVGWNDPIIKTLTATLEQTFGNVVALPISEPPTALGNIILFASNRKLEPLREPERNVGLEPDWRFGPFYHRVHAWDNRFTPDIANVKILTDDLNPIDLRAQFINLASRKDLHQYFEKSGMSW